mmetsp:Transcript_33922/g.78328  ORF Transcript_33922/g.78328 Transcript_33922/m.78328 type:complete len:93 (-) Transcript_33922:303-581(-)|eukprot:CAMPEP_0113313086 /NCGR_PEP_ID=MMETSP0010_2-20120614/9648_1 /TAXON_ID=216773 ORGANISM="Corethron hystrix, Strain 308" /NCGR_SAMPLE_ID=MMETSP0010_2 /ASSEMBLY_ACC=CAM_ASM_000155 /LENGTH=92 /DNA_ID=CAMNT_0000169023 /DNA_START=66 /DNA_END=344 /DNA_ORIENTATION=+ /assembly_acc=CAM_ASM_000155
MPKFESRAKLQQTALANREKKKGGGIIGKIAKLLSGGDGRKRNKHRKPRDSLAILKSRGADQNYRVSKDFNDQAYYASARDREAARQNMAKE